MPITTCMGYLLRHLILSVLSVDKRKLRDNQRSDKDAHAQNVGNQEICKDNCHLFTIRFNTFAM